MIPRAARSMHAAMGANPVAHAQDIVLSSHKNARPTLDKIRRVDSNDRRVGKMRHILPSKCLAKIPNGGR
jgi:hypothetical protein